MYRHILVAATGTASDVPVFHTALAVTRLPRASGVSPMPVHLEFLHVRADAEAIAADAIAAGSASPSLPSLASHLAARRMRETEGHEDDVQARAHAAVVAVCADAGLPLEGETTVADAAAAANVTASFLVERGAEGAWLAEHGRFADLIVVGRRTPAADPGRQVLETLVLDTARPVLIAPDSAPLSEPDGPLAGTVVICWTDTVQASRAVAAAAPLIAAADQVAVLTVTVDAVEPDSVAPLVRSLRRRNASVTVRPLALGAEPVAATLLAEARSLGAGVVVMGGYSHSPLRELLFGGTTLDVLASADLPVLMAH